MIPINPRERVSVKCRLILAVMLLLAGGIAFFLLAASSSERAHRATAPSLDPLPDSKPLASPAAELKPAANDALIQTDANGNLSVSSDIRLKDVVDIYATGLDALLGLEPILYHWNPASGLDTATLYAGFSAQNVKDFIPEAVGTDSHGFLTLSDRPILAAAVNAIKELARQVNDLFASDEAQNERLRSLEAEVARLRAEVDGASAPPPAAEEAEITETPGAPEEVENEESEAGAEDGESDEKQEGNAGEKESQSASGDVVAPTE